MQKPTIEHAKKLQENGYYVEAADAYESILGPIPELGNVFLMIAEEAFDQKKLDLSLLLCRRIKFTKIKDSIILGKLSALFERMWAYDEACIINKLVTKLKPNDPLAWRNYGATLNKARYFLKAERATRTALKLSPNDHVTNAYLSAILRERGDKNGAFKFAQKALEINPTFAAGHVLLSELMLANGNFKKGFIEYEWRLKLDELYAPARDLDLPDWDGSKLKGNLLISGEQGFGDVIQMCRYVPLAAQRVSKVILAVHQPLVKLLKSLGNIKVICFEHMSDVNIHAKVNIASLPFLFGTTENSIPSVVPYLSPSLETQNFWNNMFIGQKGVKVGLSWRGNSIGAADRGRSMDLQTLISLSNVKSVKFFSLQKDFLIDELLVWPKNSLINLGQSIKNFDDTAAAISKLDLIITTDTAIAHVAGAMGHPVWLLLKKYPAWRWLDGRTETPWYPTMRIFHQKKTDHWFDVIRKITGILAQYTG